MAIALGMGLIHCSAKGKVLLGELCLGGLVDTFTNKLVKKFLGKKFIPRFAKYLLKFPD